MTKSYEIPLSGSVNLDKTSFEHSLKVTPSDSKNDHVTSSSVKLEANKIVVTATFWNSNGYWASVTIKGDWKIKELN